MIHDNDSLIVLGIFREILLSSSFLAYAKKNPRYFTQSRKISLQALLLFLILRHCNTLNEEISSFFSSINQVRCSRQAMFKAMAKINPEAFRVFIWQFSARFYNYKQVTVRVMDGYIVIAVDGTHIDLPYTRELARIFGGTLNQFIKKREDIKKPQARVSMLYDVLNHILLDAWVQPYDVSEMQMVYEHLERASRVLRGKKVIILADRYYGSAELYLYCKMHGYSYIMRGKKNHYEDEVKTIREDGKITLELDAQWIKRMHHSEVQDYARKLGKLELRTVMYIYTYVDPDTNKRVFINGLYFVSTDLEHLTRNQIVSLYHMKRWKIELGYLHLKDHLEAENFNSRKADNIKSELYAKLLCLNLLNPFYFEVDRIIQDNLRPRTFRRKVRDSIHSGSDGIVPPAPLNQDEASEMTTETESTSPIGQSDSQSISRATNKEDTTAAAEQESNSSSSNTESSDENSSSSAQTANKEDETSSKERKPNVRNLFYSIRTNPRIILFLLGEYEVVYPDLSFEETFNTFCQELSLERISVRPNRHVKRWGRYIESLPHLKFRVDGRRNPIIERCRNGAPGYVTRQH